MYKTMKTSEATQRLEPATGDQKFPCIIDRAGVLKTFFQYSAATTCLVEPIIQAAMSGTKVDPEAMGELMRERYVLAAKNAHKLVYRMGGGVPTDMNKWFGTCETAHTGKFDPSIVFDPKKCRERKWFQNVVKKGMEDRDRMGNDQIYPLDDMNIILLFEAEEEETINTILKDLEKEIPNFNNYFEVFVNDN